MLKILVIEDDDSWFEIIEEGLRKKVEVLRAKTLDESYSLFQKNSDDIALIVCDACVSGNTINTIPLIKKIVESGFSKPVIASSGLFQYRQKLLKAGATHQADKDEVVALVLEILHLT